VSWRNLLIYFNGELQENILPIFRDALKLAGHLLLRSSERLSRNSDLFGVVDKQHRNFPFSAARPWVRGPECRFGSPEDAI